MKKKKIYFKYEGRTWLGKVIHQCATYESRQVYFVIIKLPNNGFCYTSDYADDADDCNQLVATDETKKDVIYPILDTIESWYGPIPADSKICVNYVLAEQRFEIHIWYSKVKCVTVKYEYGSVQYIKCNPESKWQQVFKEYCASRKR